MIMLTTDQYTLVFHKCEEASLDAIWQMFEPIHQSWTHFDDELCHSFEHRCDAFLWVLERLLKEGRIRLHRKGEWWDAPIEKQVEAFRQAFPKSEEDADRICTKPGYEKPYDGFGMNVWWFMDVCPASVAWRQPDGSYQIAD